MKNTLTLVTGATGGIGQAICRELATRSGGVIIHFRSQEDKAKALAEELMALGASSALLWRCDLDNPEIVEEASKDFFKTAKITGLVNNAGISRDGLLARAKAKDIQEVLTANLASALTLTAQALRPLMAAGPVGSVVNISSVVGLMGNTAQCAYSASKAGLVGFTKSLAREYASRGLRVNCIAPGFIESPMTQALGEVVRQEYLTRIPLGRFGDPADVAKATAFLLGPDSRYITGQTLKIDGGLYI
jgi:3-oxoacyl-[acyl-carrier protein] reductase